MKKFLFSAVAAGALAFGGAASAQDLGTAIGNVLGSVFGVPSYTQNHGYGYGAATPAVVAQPYGSNVHVDQYGRQVYVDQYGRQVLVQSSPNVYGANAYGGVAYDSYGRPVMRDQYGNYVYGSGNHAYSGRSWDRDGDGIANHRDRWPDNPSYF